MYWVYKRSEQRAASRIRKEKLNSGAEPIWESLCQAARDSIEAYKAKEPNGGRFEQDGNNHHLYWVRYVDDTPQRNTEKRKITITFDAIESTIAASYYGVPFEPRLVKLIVDDGDNIRFEFDQGNHGSADAAAHLLDPFLFPDLATNPMPREIAFVQALRKTIG